MTVFVTILGFSSILINLQVQLIKSENQCNKQTFHFVLYFCIWIQFNRTPILTQGSDLDLINFQTESQEFIIFKRNLVYFLLETKMLFKVFKAVP